VVADTTGVETKCFFYVFVIFDSLYIYLCMCVTGQAELMFDAVKAKGLPVSLTIFQGEQVQCGGGLVPLLALLFCCFVLRCVCVCVSTGRA